MLFAIDFGTSKSLISYIDEEGHPQIVQNERGNRKTPTVVSFKNEKEVYVGEIAKNQAVLEAESTVSNIKRFLGKKFEFKYKNRSYTSSEIATIIFRKLKKIVEDNLNSKMKDVVITTPAYFDNNQREDIIYSASQAGLNVISLLNEPTAAALAYRFNDNRNVMVIDIGGGTVDISFIIIENNAYKVIGVSGNTEIGGIDYDNKLSEYFLDKFKEKYKIDLKKDRIAYQQLLIQSERVKIDVSSSDETSLMLPYIAYNEKGPVHIKEKIDKKLFYNITKEITDKIIDTIKKSFKENNINRIDIDTVVIAGGGAKIYPLINEVKKIFVDNNVEFFYNINPEEVVSIGAAIYTGIMEKKIEKIEFTNVTSYGLGIIDDNGKYIELIPKNTPFPVSKDKLFTTAEDYQTEVYIPVCQKDVNGNLIQLDTFILSNLRKEKAGNVNINVTFEINKNGILSVSGIDIDSYQLTEIIIESPFIKKTSNRKERRGRGITIL